MGRGLEHVTEQMSLQTLLRTQEWERIREALLHRMDASCFYICADGALLYRFQQDKSVCRLIRERRKRECEDFILSAAKRASGVSLCPFGLLSFVEHAEGLSLGACQAMPQQEKKRVLFLIKRRIGLDMEQTLHLFECTPSIKKEDFLKEALKISESFKHIVHECFKEKRLLEEQFYKRIEAEAEAEALSFLYRLNEALCSLNDVESICAHTLTLARSFFGQKVGVAFVEQTLYLHSTARLEKDLIYKIKEKVLEVLQEPAQIKECKLLQEGQEQTKNLCSYILSPLQQRQKSIGVLGVFNEGSRAYTFSDRKVFSLLCATVSQHLIRATLFQRVKEEAEQDPLTGVYNIKYFKEILEREFARAKRYRRPLSLIMLDFDHLKEFNDRFGHPEGSRLIKLVASCIKKNVRAQDYVARYGGDEFIMLLPETGVEGARVVAERIRALIKSVSPHRGSASFGLAEAESAKDPMTLLSMADKALYQAKSEGRDMVCVWRRELEQAPSHEVTQILD